ncbi:hypothetical protein QWZ10_22545 [Paracoccus cavernae]|uniref:Cation transporter n=2 Tax=Paracoccus cavernae TaxID=1571207 RepID=A0ABT8DBI9_9RHOB|nr:hypothetical protein [Paracoccus cavernae]
MTFLTDEERAAWKSALSVESNPLLQQAVDTYGREAYELVLKVTAAQGGTEPVRWWKL